MVKHGGEHVRVPDKGAVRQVATDEWYLREAETVAARDRREANNRIVELQAQLAVTQG